MHRNNASFGYRFDLRREIAVVLLKIRIYEKKNFYVDNMRPTGFVEHIHSTEMHRIEMLRLFNHLMVDHRPDHPSFQDVLNFMSTALKGKGNLALESLVLLIWTLVVTTFLLVISLPEVQRNRSPWIFRPGIRNNCRHSWCPAGIAHGGLSEFLKQMERVYLIAIR